ncbi:phospholipase A2 [Capronia epimyces CBS 606.96]|uniref:Lysophospholipase n=1 Tax=Capronia epimyces CBS 606.96 TaxID=1182542 RepID=W9XA14_9EURO|nr:phospholipase A2 [Capronia epimyces CBS 606.96]EXJ77058.1 phospholipase A2 [Capronia epimyces CBS 606.96]
MGAARLLNSSRLRQTALLAAACAGVHSATRRSPLVRLDSPSGTHIPQDASLVSYTRRKQNDRAQAEDAKHAATPGDVQPIGKANDLEHYTPAFEPDDENSWAVFSRNFQNFREGIASIEWSSIPDKITDFVLPSWAKLLPEGIQKLQLELSMQPGSLADEIWQEAHDPEINPEILWNATVRVGDTLGPDELEFRRKRKERVVKALAKYLDINETEIHPDDVPTIAMCGSGGGLRAMVAGTSSYLSAQDAGLFDCVTYMAGVSGSCWLQSLFFSSLGKQDFRSLLKHLKARLGTHIAFPPAALKLVTSAPTNKFILSGFIEKIKGDPGASFGLVDVYSLLLAARLLVPHGDLDVHDQDLKLSNQRMYLANGEYPLPIYTAVRHEIPVDEEEIEEAKDNLALKEEIKDKAQKEAWFQWFEMHPWEVWCEEFGAGIPTWSLGRPFNKGQNQLLDTGVALPEIRQSLLLGVWGSAFCATLSHYYKEIKPALVGIVGFGGLDGLLEEKNDDLMKIHPIDPATFPNFVYGMKDQLPSTCPDSVFKNGHLQLMDAGMSNNLPIYPLLRPGRDVEILIAFDASADIQRENWLSVVDGYAKQRGVKGWPVGAGWPQASSKPQENALALEEAQATSAQEAATKVAEAREGSREAKASGSIGSNAPESPTTGQRPDAETTLGACNVWVGTKAERSIDREPPPSKRLAWDDLDDSTFHLMHPEAGLAVVYFPLIPNPKVKGVDPDKTDYMSTWNFVYTPEQIDDVVALAKANFEEGADVTKQTVRAVYERKKRVRMEREARERRKAWKVTLREHGDHFGGA